MKTIFIRITIEAGVWIRADIVKADGTRKDNLYHARFAGDMAEQVKTIKERISDTPRFKGQTIEYLTDTTICHK